MYCIVRTESANFGVAGEGKHGVSGSQRGERRLVLDVQHYLQRQEETRSRGQQLHTYIHTYKHTTIIYLAAHIQLHTYTYTCCD